MGNQLDKKRIGVYLGVAFVIPWLGALYLYFNGGLMNSPELIPGSRITLATVVLALVYMWGPALAHILTRLITREGWKDMHLRLNFRKTWKYWLAGWLGPGVLTLVGMMVYFMIFPAHFDPNLDYVRTMLEPSFAAAGQTLPDNLWPMVMLQMLQALLIAPLINSVFTFGEEFGWRAYLQPKLMPLGGRKAMLWMGVIWGVWHWPVIAMGHNYGIEYAGYPWLGMLMMVWFTLVLGTFLGWAALKSRSVWPAVIGHAGINGVAGIGILMSRGNVNPLLGPMPVGLIGSVGFLAAAIWIFTRKAELEAAPAEDFQPVVPEV